MVAPKQYHFDSLQAHINRLELEKRKGKKWKQLELLDKLKHREDKETVLFNPIVLEYRKVLRVACDDEVKNKAEKCIQDTSANNRKSLERHFSNEIVDVPLSNLQPSKIEEGKIPMNIRTYNQLKKDILLKGILHPLLITDASEIIDGHQRYNIAKELGFKDLPCRIVYLRYLSEHQKYRVILELRFSSNAGRRQLSMKEERKLQRLWRTFFTEKVQRGRPTKKAENLCTALQVNGVGQMSEIDRHLARLYGVMDI